MKKNIILSAFLIFSFCASFAEQVPIPKCACDDISNQINLEKKAELKIKDEAKQIDYDIKKIDNEYNQEIENVENKIKTKKPWWRFGR